MNRFAKYVWGVLVYNIAVIIWGTYVRATGSGAACGAHWPLCNGQVIPLEPQLATVIEFSHRASSGLALVSVIILIIWAFRVYPQKHIVRIGAMYSMALMISEALVGAGLVLFKLAGDNTSIVRAFSTSLHLINTFLLLAAITLTAWWASGGQTPHIRFNAKSVMFTLAIIGMLVLGISGAIAALGDALFPAQSLAEGFALDMSPTAHIFLRLRIFHPIIAIGVGLYLMIISAYFGLTHASAKRWAITLITIIAIQWIAGVVNVVLLAPVWMQMLHLLITNLLWISFVIMSVIIFGETDSAVEINTQPIPSFNVRS